MLTTPLAAAVSLPSVLAPSTGKLANTTSRRTAPRASLPNPVAPTLYFPSLETLVALTLTLIFSLGLAPGVALAADPPVVNVNTAEAADLALLPRVGPALSQRIVEFREENGKFGDPAELMLVQGIGERTFELLEAYLILEGETTLDTKIRTSDAQALLEAKQAGGTSDD